MRTINTPERLIGAYGPDWTRGVISDHERIAVEMGLPVRVSASGKRRYVVIDHRAEPVLCSEVVEILTEDGPIDGRCGIPVEGDAYACPGHEAIIAHYRREA